MYQFLIIRNIYLNWYYKIQSQMIEESQDKELLQMRRIQQIFTYAKTFRMHPLLMLGKVQVSPYDLACNGFINKDFKQQEKLVQNQQQDILALNQRSIISSLKQKSISLSQVTSCCKVIQCMKIIRLNQVQNQKYDQISHHDQVQLILTDHQQNCKFWKQKFQVLSLTQLFNLSHAFFMKIHLTYDRDQHRIIDQLLIDWDLVDKLLFSSFKCDKSNILLQCYKRIDTKFSILTKKFTKSILLSLFGWSLVLARQNISAVFKCHFCGIKKEVFTKEKKQALLNRQTKVFKDQQKFNFFQSHNSWCLVLNKKYEIWKLALKKNYIEVQNDTSKKDLPNKKICYTIPKTELQIQSKQLRYQVYESAKSTLQKIDLLLQSSLQVTKKQVKKDNQFQTKYQKSLIGDKNQQYFERFTSLDQISKKCQEIIRNFINSIEVKQKFNVCFQ